MSDRIHRFLCRPTGDLRHLVVDSDVRAGRRIKSIYIAMLVSVTILCVSCSDEERSVARPAEERAQASSDSVPMVGRDGVYPDESALFYCLLRRMDIEYGATGESINIAWREDGTVYDHRGTALLRSTHEAWADYVVSRIREHGGIDEVRSGGDLLHGEHDGYEDIPQFIYRLQFVEDNVVRVDIIDKR